MKRFCLVLSLVFASLNIFAQDMALFFAAQPTNPIEYAFDGGLATNGQSRTEFNSIAATPFATKHYYGGVSYTVLPSELSSGGTLPGINAMFATNIKDIVGIKVAYTYQGSSKQEGFNDEGTPTGEFSASRHNVAFGLSWRFWKYMSIGVEGKYVVNKLTPNVSCSGFGVNAMLYGSWKGLKATAGVRNIGTKGMPAHMMLSAGYNIVDTELYSVGIYDSYKYYFAGFMENAIAVEGTIYKYVTVKAAYNIALAGHPLPSSLSVGLGGHAGPVDINFTWASFLATKKNYISVGLSLAF